MCPGIVKDRGIQFNMMMDGWAKLSRAIGISYVYCLAYKNSTIATGGVLVIYINDSRCRLNGHLCINGVISIEKISIKKWNRKSLGI